MLRIVHVITGLSVGGAQMSLLKLLGAMNRDEFDPLVVSLSGNGPMGEKIERLGVRVELLGMRRGKISPSGIFRLARIIRRHRPQLVQTWMYHADLLGGVAAKLAVRAPVVWNIRHTNLEPAMNKRGTIWTAKVCAALSGILPSRILCNSQSSKIVHGRFGYRAEKIVVVPNGFDTAVFKPDSRARHGIRHELSIGESSVLVGLIGRYDPQKDHRNFIEAVSHMSGAAPDAHFLLCGEDITWDNLELSALIRDRGLERRFHLLGKRDDIPWITASLDIAVSSSCGEGFPNVIGEAMSCGVPCIVTDVGDSAWLVGESGTVVPPRSPLELSVALQEMVSSGERVRQELGALGRQRIIDDFSIDAVAGRYAELYREVAEGRRAAS